MIYEFMRAALEKLDGLEDKVFPPGVCVDDVDGPFVVYTFGSRRPVTDLSGEVHHYEETVTLEFLGPVYDKLHELYLQAEDALNVSNYDTGCGEYIFGTSCSSSSPDGHYRDAALYSRTMQWNVYWCPIDFDP